MAIVIQLFIDVLNSSQLVGIQYRLQQDKKRSGANIYLYILAAHIFCPCENHQSLHSTGNFFQKLCDSE